MYCSDHLQHLMIQVTGLVLARTPHPNGVQEDDEEPEKAEPEQKPVRKPYIDEHGAQVVPIEDHEMTGLYGKWVRQAASALLSSLSDHK